MVSDIVRPDGNEKELAEMAEMLGYDKLYFAYPFDSKSEIPKLKIKSEKIIIVSSTKELMKSKGKKVIYKGSDDIRKAIEIGPTFICDIETSSRKDFIHHRNSGLNQVTAKIASEKKVIFGIPLSTLLETKKLPELMGRIRQNIRLWKKYGLEVRFFSFASNQFDMRAPSELKSLAEDLGIQDVHKVIG